MKKAAFSFIKRIILSETLMFMSITNVIAQDFIAPQGYMSPIPGRFMKSGESAISWLYQENENVSVSIYGKGFKEMAQLSFTLPSVSYKYAKYETVVLENPFIYNVEVNDSRIDSLTTVDTLITIYNELARNQNNSIDNDGYDYMGNTEQWPIFNDITTSEVFAKVMGKFDYYSIQYIFSYNLQVNSFTPLSNVKTTSGKISSYPLYFEEGDDYYYYNDYGYYQKKMFGNEYPLYYATIENGIVYIVYMDYSSTNYVNIPDPDALEWKETNSYEYEFDDNRYYVSYYFNEINYANIDELIEFESDFYFTQTLFNADEKYEFIKREYESGDWIFDDDYYHTDSIIRDYRNDVEYQIIGYNRFNGYNISIDYTYDDKNNYVPAIKLARKFNRDIRRNLQVVSDDGSVLFEYRCSIPGAYAYASIMTFNGTNYLVIEEDVDKNAGKTVIYEIKEGMSGVKLIERVSQPFATAYNGIISMKLDYSHTDSNASLYNMDGQTVGSRYIEKGETNPTMNASELPDGIYNLLLNRNGQTISSQKMLIK